MKSFRISSRADSTASWPERGMTFDARRISLPPLFKTPPASPAAAWFPATTMGTANRERASRRAL
jgi:hypothetical protein